MNHHCQGASLIESLTALSVFAVGSAAGGVWFQASMAADAAASRTMATMAAIADLRERMYANAPGMSEGSYNTERLTRFDPASPAGCAAGCTPAQLAADDLARFRARLHRQVGASVTVVVHCEEATGCRLRAVLGRDVLADMAFVP